MRSPQVVTRQPTLPTQPTRIQSACSTGCLPICKIRNSSVVPDSCCIPGCCGVVGWGPVGVTAVGCGGGMLAASHQMGLLTTPNPYITVASVAVSACCGSIGACIAMYRSGMCGCCGAQEFVIGDQTNSRAQNTDPTAPDTTSRNLICCCCPTESMHSSDPRGLRLQLDLPIPRAPRAPQFKITSYV